MAKRKTVLHRITPRPNYRRHLITWHNGHPDLAELESTMLLIMEGTPPLRGVPYPTF